MKIGIVSIGNDSLELFRFLHRYDHEYVVYYDADAWPLGDKTRTRQLEIVQQGYDRLVAEGCDHILLPPVGEIGKVGKNSENSEIGKNSGIGTIGHILPLYQAYVMQVFGQSLVGKIGYLAESGHRSPPQSPLQGEASLNVFQQGLQQWASEHQRTEAQTNTKQFHRPFAWRGRDVRQRKYFLRSLSPRDYLINKVVKFDLRKLKDADVDTILPTERSHFAMEKTIERFFRSRRTRWHGMQVLEQCFVDELKRMKKDEGGGRRMKEDSYGVTILSRGDVDMLESVQKYSRLMSRGKTVDIVKKSLD